MPGKQERMLTTKDLAERIGVAPKTIREWRRQNRLPRAVRLKTGKKGRESWAWPEAAIAEWERQGFVPLEGFERKCFHLQELLGKLDAVEKATQLPNHVRELAFAGIQILKHRAMVLDERIGIGDSLIKALIWFWEDGELTDVTAELCRDSRDVMRQRLRELDLLQRGNVDTMSLPYAAEIVWRLANAAGDKADNKLQHECAELVGMLLEPPSPEAFAAAALVGVRMTQKLEQERRATTAQSN
jgi:predicted DNA-binding transcriptional regulator AlpA